MRLSKARIRSYRSIIDTGIFDVESAKTIFVGPNEAGKTAILQALQHINPPALAPKLDALRDYPRSLYNDISVGKVKPSDVTVVEGYFELDAADISELPAGFEGCTYVRGRKLDNTSSHRLDGAPPLPKYGDLKKDIVRLCAHIDSRSPEAKAGEAAVALPSASLATVTTGWNDDTLLSSANAKTLNTWLTAILPLIDETNEAEEKLSNSVQYFPLISVQFFPLFRLSEPGFCDA